ncbi:MAG: hypothetical protein WCW02_03850 [Candidatus Buchananbacteria bacterium]
MMKGERDFSTEEAQKNFSALPKEEQQEYIDRSKDVAEIINSDPRLKVDYERYRLLKLAGNEDGATKALGALKAKQTYDVFKIDDITKEVLLELASEDNLRELLSAEEGKVVFKLKNWEDGIMGMSNFDKLKLVALALGKEVNMEVDNTGKISQEVEIANFGNKKSYLNVKGEVCTKSKLEKKKI